MAAIIREVLSEFNAAKPGTVFFDPTTDELFSLFQHPLSRYLVVESDDGLIGGAGIYPTPGLPAGYCELVKLYLVKDFRGKGLGKKLISECCKAAKSFGFTQLYLESMPELATAVTLYEKFGFGYLPASLGSSGHFGCDIWMSLDLEKFSG